MDSGRGITGGGSGYAAILANAEGALYGTELGSVTLKRIGFFCFPIKHSTHTGTELGSVTLKRIGFFCFPIKHSTHTPQRLGSVTVTLCFPIKHSERVCCLLVLNLVSSTLSCIRRPRPRLLVLHTHLKESWFILFSN